MAILARDQVTVSDLTDGISVILEKYAHIFNGGVSAAVAGSTTCAVTAMIGADKVACSVVAANVECPTGVSVTVANNGSATLTLTISCTTAFVAPGFVKIPVVVGEVTIIQTMAVAFAKTGATGTSATIAGLKNEAQMIPCDSAGKILEQTDVNVDFYGYVGGTRAAVTASIVAADLTAVGVTIIANTAGTASVDGVLTLRFPKDGLLGGNDVGSLYVSLVCNGITRTQPFSWSKARRGVNGSDAFTLDIVSSQGLTFKNEAIATVLTANVYKGGGAPLTGASLTAVGAVKWYKDGAYLTGKDGVSLTVTAGDVQDKASYVAQLEG